MSKSKADTQSRVWGEPVILRVEDVARLFNCSVTSIWRWAQQGKLPKPRKIGQRFTFWKREEIEDALENILNERT
ncbi:MAG: helix-turn-helix domain-containing protein [Desulfovibrio sp.]|nr:helix-turn-helix domain-containing protein [Desulfovibrio sp.]